MTDACHIFRRWLLAPSSCLADLLPHLTWEFVPSRMACGVWPLSLLSTPLRVLSLVLQLLVCCPSPSQDIPLPLPRKAGAVWIGWPQSGSIPLPYAQRVPPLCPDKCDNPP